jgi:transposase
MRLKHSGQPKASVERVVRDIRRATRRHFSAEDKIKIVLDGLRGEDITLFESNFNAEFSFSADC